MDQNQYYTPNQVPSPKRTKFFAIAIAFIIIAIVGMLAYVFRDKLSGLFSGAKPVAVFCKSRNPVGIPGMQLTFAGLGGNGTSYSWSAPSGVPNSGDGQGFATVFNKIGNYSVTVESGGASDTCNVRIIDPAPDLDFGSITLNGNDGINPYIGNGDRNIPCIAPLDTVSGQPFNLDTQTRFSLSNRGFADATGVMVKFTQSGISGAFDAGNVTVSSGTFTKISDTEGKWVIPSIIPASWANITFKKSGVIASNINLTGQVMALDQTDFDRGGDDRAIMACATTDYLSAPSNSQTPPASTPTPANDTPAPINNDLPAPVINETPTPIKQSDTPTQEVKGVSTGTKLAVNNPTPTIDPGINPNPIINPPPAPGETCEDAPSEAFLRQYGVTFRILHNAVLVKNTGPKCFRFTLKGHDVVTGNLYPFGEQVLKQTKVFTVSAGVTAIITLDQAPLPCSFQTDLQLGDKTGINEGVIAYDFMEHKCVTPPSGKLTCAPANQNGQVGQPVTFTATNGSLPIWTAPGGQPIGGRGSNFETTYDTAGSYTVTVQSNGQVATCNVTIGAPQGQTLTCSPATQTVQINTPATFNATGGTGSYTWNTTGDNPTKPPTGSSTTFTYPLAGNYVVTVFSGTAQATCNVVVTTTPPPATPLSCSPEAQTTTINTTVNFQARGGNGTYSWLATEGTPATGTTANFATKFATPTRGIAAKQVKVTSAGVDAFCYVTVNDVTVTQEQADLAIVKTASNSTPVINTNFTYTIVISNIGPNNASGISVRDQLPTGITLVAVHAGSPSQGTFNTADGVWTVGALNVGRNATLLLDVRATQTGSIANTASITASSLPDPVTSNNQSTATINVSGGGGGGGGGGTTYDVGVAKTASTSTPTVGQNVSFTITATNFSSNSVTNVTIRDVLPSQVTYVSHTQTAGSYNQGTGIWTLGTMSNGAQATLNIIATVNTSGSITNTTTVNSLDQTDSNSNNNQASVTITASSGGGGGGGGGGSSTDLAVTKSVNNSTPTLGSNVIFTLTVFNNGPLAATNVTLRDQLPSGLVYVSSNPSQGSYNQSTGIWTVGSLPVSTSANLQLTVTVNQAGTTTNTGQVNTLDQSESNSTNNSASSSVTVGTGSGTGADIGVTKSVSTDRPVVGSQIVFTINAVNYGPQAATGVTLTDLLPSQVTFVKYQATSGTYDRTTGIWNIGSMASGASAVLQITATVVKQDNFTNIVRVTTSNPSDPNTTNNQAQVTVTSTQAPGLPAAGFNTAAPIVIGFLFIFLALAVKFMGSTPKQLVATGDDKNIQTFTRFD